MFRSGTRATVAALITLIAMFSVACAPPPPDSERIPRSGTIAFVSERTGNDELYVMDANGSGVERLTNNPGFDRAPSWDRSGTQLVFNSRRAPHENRPEIYRMDFPSRTITRVTDEPAEHQRGSWTPDGDAIVFQRGSFVTGFGIWRHELATGAEVELVSFPGRISAAPSISPDGSQLVFQSNHESSGIFPFRLYTLDLQTGEVEPFFHAATGSDDGPRWSPDGTRVAFSSSRDGRSSLFVATPDTGELRRLTDLEGSDISPAWSPDGSALVFQSDRVDDDGGIHVINVATGRTEYRGEGRTPVWSPTDRRNLGLR